MRTGLATGGLCHSCPGEAGQGTAKCRDEMRGRGKRKGENVLVRGSAARELKGGPGQLMLPMAQQAFCWSESVYLLP